MKWLTRSLAAFGIFLFFILSLLFTYTGNLLLWQQVQHWVPQLQGKLVEGHIGKGVSIENLVWNDPHVTFQVDRLTIDWQLSSLLKKQVWITQLDALNPVILLSDTPSEQSNNSDTATTTDISSLPASIAVDTISIKGFSLHSSDINVSFKQLSSSLTFDNNGLTINDSTVKLLTVATKEPTSQPQTQGKHKTETKPVVLPPVELPFAIKIKQLQLTDSLFETEKVPGIFVALTGLKHKISIQSLAVKHPMANLQLSGAVSLTDSYTVDLTVDAALKKPLTGDLPEGQTLHALLTGNLDQLHARIDAKGTAHATLTGSIEPLKNQLPFNLTLDWQPLQWPLAGNNPVVYVQQGHATVTGNLSGYLLNVDTRVSAKSQPSVSLLLEGTGNTSHLSFNEAQLETSEGSATVQGKLDWSDHIDWQGQLRLQAFNPSFWVPELPGHINGVVTHHFHTTPEGWNLEISNASAHGKLRNHPVTFKGKVDGNNKMQWRFEKIELAIGSNTIHINGSLAEQWDVNASLNGPDLSQLYPDLKGSVTGRINLTGNMQQPAIAYNLNSPELSWQQLSLSNLKSFGTVKKDQEYTGSVNFHLNKLHNSTLTVQNIALNLEGKESDHRLTLTSDGTQAAADITLSGAWSKHAWHGLLKQAQLNTPAGKWTLSKPLPLYLDAQQTLKMESQCWQSGKASLCIDPTSLSQKAGQAVFALDAFGLQRLKPFYPQAFVWQADLSGKGQFQWHDNKPTLTLELSTTPGTITASDLKQNYETLNLALSLDEQALHSQLNFLSQGLGKADINLSVSDVQQKRLLSGQLAITDVMLNILASFVPEISQIKGFFSADGRFGGSLQQPLFFGHFALNEGGMKTTQDIVSISHLNTRMNIAGSSGTISGTMQVGQGALNLGGNLDWTNLPPTGQITFKGEGLEAQYPGIGQLHLSPDLALNVGKEQSITGQIAIPWARIKIKELPPHAVTRSDDVVIIRSGQGVTDKKALAAPIKVKVQVAVGQNVKLEAFGLQTELQGALGIVQLPEKPLEIHGTMQLSKGKYQSLGQDLVINEGKIIFSGPPDNPYLVLQAIRNPDAIEDNVTVGVLVNGPVAKPEWQLFSDPAMPQAEQFSYLLRGRATKSDAGDSNALESALVGVGVSKLGGFVSTIGETVGVSDLTLDTTGSGDDTQVTISGYVAPKLQVQYGVGVFNSIGEVKVKYELMPQLYLQAISGLAQALDIFYRFSL